MKITFPLNFGLDARVSIPPQTTAATTTKKTTRTTSRYTTTPFSTTQYDEGTLKMIRNMFVIPSHLFIIYGPIDFRRRWKGYCGGDDQ